MTLIDGLYVGVQFLLLGIFELRGRLVDEADNVDQPLELELFVLQEVVGERTELSPGGQHFVDKGRGGLFEVGAAQVSDFHRGVVDEKLWVLEQRQN